MKKKERVGKAAGVSDEAVYKRTGKHWHEWFAILDQAGAQKMNHTQIATYLYEEHGCPGWWSQMVTVGYEQERGLREKHERPSGYEISRSKTIAVPIAKLYQVWQDKKSRNQWLKDSDITVRKATANKSMRVTWVDGKTSLDVNFYSKGDGKSQVTVQHQKLASAKEAERMQAYWGKQLERLKEMLK